MPFQSSPLVSLFIIGQYFGLLFFPRLEACKYAHPPRIRSNIFNAYNFVDSHKNRRYLAR